MQAFSLPAFSSVKESERRPSSLLGPLWIAARDPKGPKGNHSLLGMREILATPWGNVFIFSSPRR